MSRRIWAREQQQQQQRGHTILLSWQESRDLARRLVPPTINDSFRNEPLPSREDAILPDLHHQHLAQRSTDEGHTHEYEQEDRTAWTIDHSRVKRHVECDVCCEVKYGMSVLDGRIATLPCLTRKDGSGNAVDEADIVRCPCFHEVHHVCRSCLRRYYHDFGRVDCPAPSTKHGVHGGVTYNRGVFNVPDLNEWTGVPDYCVADGRWDTVKKKTLTETLKEILAYDVRCIPCGKCGTMLQRSSDCNALSHCRHETCFACGETEEGHLPGTHWFTSDNETGCPRYDEQLLTVLLTGMYTCQYNHCYTDGEPCTVASHQFGRQQLQDAWKTFLIARTVERAALHEWRNALSLLSNTEIHTIQTCIVRVRAWRQIWRQT